MTQQPPKRPLNRYAKYSSALFQMIAIIGIGTFAGVKLDEAYPNEHSLYTVILATFSVLLALYVVIRHIRNITKEEEKDA